MKQYGKQLIPVSYTHLDVYNRQEYNKATNAVIIATTSRTYASGFIVIKYTKS